MIEGTRIDLFTVKIYNVYYTIVERLGENRLATYYKLKSEHGGRFWAEPKRSRR